MSETIVFFSIQELEELLLPLECRYSQVYKEKTERQHDKKISIWSYRAAQLVLSVIPEDEVPSKKVEIAMVGYVLSNYGMAWWNL